MHFYCDKLANLWPKPGTGWALNRPPGGWRCNTHQGVKKFSVEFNSPNPC